MDNTPPKSMYMLGVIIGGGIGGYLPSLFGADYFSLWGILGSAIGGILGIWLIYKIYTSWL
jgi:hypothetical protein